MTETLSSKVVALLNNLEAYRKALRLYPLGHPGLAPAQSRVRSAVRALADEPVARLVVNPDHVFWGEEEVLLPPEAPGRKLVQILFQLGLAVLQMWFPQAEEGFLALAEKLSVLTETPREEDREKVLQAAEEFPGIELFPLDLSGVQIVTEEEVRQKDGSRIVWPRLARILAREGAFAWPGKLQEGLLDAESVVALATKATDPGPLFDYLFQAVGQVFEQSPQPQRPLMVAELRLFLSDLCRLLQPEGRARAVAAFLRQPTLASLMSEKEPLAPLTALLDGVELLLLEGEPIPNAVERMLFKLASPEAAEEMGLPAELVFRARQMLPRLPLGHEKQEDFAPPTRVSLPESWSQEPWAQELSASLAPQEVRSHFVRALGEMVTLWPGQPAGEAAALRAGQLFGEAVQEGDYATAQRLGPLIGASRNLKIQEKNLEQAVAAIRAALAVADRQAHPLLTAILTGLGEAALPALLEALASEERLAVRKRLLEAILRLGNRAVPYVRTMLEDDRWYVVRNAVFLLRRLQDRAVIPALKKLLESARPQVVGEILKTLVAFTDPDWLPLLRKELASEDEERVRVALAVASRIRHPAVVGMLVDRLRQQIGMRLRDPLTFELIDALGRLRDGRAFPILQEILELKQWRFPFSLEPIRQRVAFAIGQLDSPEARKLALALASGKDKSLAEAVRRAAITAPLPEEDEEG